MGAAPPAVGASRCDLGPGPPTRASGRQGPCPWGQGAREVCLGELARQRIFVSFLDVGLACVSGRALQNAVPSVLGPLRPLDSGRAHTLSSRPGCCWRRDGLVTRRRDPHEAGRGAETRVLSRSQSAGTQAEGSRAQGARLQPCSVPGLGGDAGGHWSSLRLGPRAGRALPQAGEPRPSLLPPLEAREE